MRPIQIRPITEVQAFGPRLAAMHPHHPWRGEPFAFSCDDLLPKTNSIREQSTDTVLLMSGIACPAVELARSLARNSGNTPVIWMIRSFLQVRKTSGEIRQICIKILKADNVIWHGVVKGCRHSCPIRPYKEHLRTLKTQMSKHLKLAADDDQTTTTNVTNSQSPSGDASSTFSIVPLIILVLILAILMLTGIFWTLIRRAKSGKEKQQSDTNGKAQGGAGHLSSPAGDSTTPMLGHRANGERTDGMAPENGGVTTT
uniref:Uncharacterized protein n=1 Tax=Globodera rostochiensis TaxID=31243 RepID=A0A914I3M8_GLORO